MSEFDCPICFESYPIADGCILCSSFNGKGDSRKIHQFCIDCIKGIAKSATEDAPIADGGIGLPCPVEECQNVLHINNFEFYLDSNIYTALIQRFQEEAIIAAEMDDLVTCPGCHMKFCVDSNLKFYDCHCGRRQCRKCPRVYDAKHDNISCSKLDELDRQRVLEPKLSEIAVRVCHRCNLQFVKEDGCNKMECRCKALQCYLCRQPVEDYSHFCECGWKGTSGKCPTCSKSCPLWGDPEERDRIQMEEVMNASEDIVQGTPILSANCPNEHPMNLIGDALEILELHENEDIDNSKNSEDSDNSEDSEDSNNLDNSDDSEDSQDSNNLDNSEDSDDSKDLEDSDDSEDSEDSEDSNNLDNSEDSDNSNNSEDSEDSNNSEDLNISYNLDNSEDSDDPEDLYNPEDSD